MRMMKKYKKATLAQEIYKKDKFLILISKLYFH